MANGKRVDPGEALWHERNGRIPVQFRDKFPFARPRQARDIREFRHLLIYDVLAGDMRMTEAKPAGST